MKKNPFRYFNDIVNLLILPFSLHMHEEVRKRLNATHKTVYHIAVNALSIGLVFCGNNFGHKHRLKAFLSDFTSFLCFLARKMKGLSPLSACSKVAN